MSNKEFIQDSLKKLTDEKLLQYHDLYKSMVNKSNRAEGTKINGVDRKFLYHVVRLLGEVEQLLSTGDMDLQQDKERLKAIRNGKWTIKQIKEFFEAKEKDLEALYHSSELPYSPREDEVKALLIQCLEMHYSDITDIIVPQNRIETALRRIKEIVDKVDI